MSTLFQDFAKKKKKKVEIYIILALFLYLSADVFCVMKFWWNNKVIVLD